MFEVPKTIYECLNININILKWILLSWRKPFISEWSAFAQPQFIEETINKEWRYSQRIVIQAEAMTVIKDDSFSVRTPVTSHIFMNEQTNDLTSLLACQQDR